MKKPTQLLEVLPNKHNIQNNTQILIQNMSGSHYNSNEHCSNICCWSPPALMTSLRLCLSFKKISLESTNAFMLFCLFRKHNGGVENWNHYWFLFLSRRQEMEQKFMRHNFEIICCILKSRNYLIQYFYFFFIVILNYAREN